MVGLVLVSHSRPLAQSLVKLVEQVSERELAIAYAAGAGPDHQEFGTDAMEIMEAIQRVYSEEGVLVLMDMGSAVLSAEMALEFLPEEMQSNIRFSTGPLVEGAIAAGVQTSLGSDLETVLREAQLALHPKAEQLGQPIDQMTQPLTAEPTTGEGPAQEMSLTLRNAHGLHARPAARFVQLASSFDVEIQVTNTTTGKGPISAKSLNALATLGAVHGHEIKISAWGPQSTMALDALQDLVEGNFGEEEAPTPDISFVRPSTKVEGEDASHAVPVSEGIALGPLYTFKPPVPPIPDHQIEDPDHEWEVFQKAVDQTRGEIQSRRFQIRTNLGESHAAIFDAHLLILDDPELQKTVRGLIFDQGVNAIKAWNEAIDQVAESYRALENPYLQQRAVDVEDVGSQVVLALAGSDIHQKVVLDQPVILVAEELTPTQTAQLEMDQVLGLVTVGGGPTSHSAILARALGIPAIAGADPMILTTAPDTLIGLDGFQGLLYIDPSVERQDELAQSREQWLDQRARLVEASHQQAVTRDGHEIEIAANVGNPVDAEAAVKNGAQGIGLLRTEFLYLTRNTPPTEEEQISVLEQIGEIMGTKSVIVRTLDVGGDKELPYIDLPHEENPFLGVRAIRLSLRNPDLFCRQLRAILRAGSKYPLRIMFPMVTTLDELLQAKKILETAHQELEAENLPHRWPIETGIMIETPAAAVLSPIFAPHIDFVSVGTNDLTQYTLAAERGNPELSSLADALNPAILRLLQIVVEAAHQRGVWVGICGELAGDPAATPILAGLGVDELSMNPGSIPKIKALFRKLNLSEAKSIAQDALQCDSPSAVRDLAEGFINRLN